MRYQLAADGLDVETYFQEIISKKNLKTRALLVTAKDDVISLCNDYAKTLKNLKAPTQGVWDASTIEALKSCYAVSTMGLSSHKDLILAALKVQSEINVQRCAYCMLNDPKTWDHYMPKDFFPEYSVFHENLVYICYGCNQRKSSYFDKNNLIYCHPYFTVDPDHALLHCKVTVANGKLSIQYYGSGIGSLKQAGVVLHEHITRLDLIDRFKSEAASTVSGLIGELRQYHPKGISQESLDRVLERRYNEAQEKLGCNAWDSRLWHGLAACQDFLAYVNGKVSLIGAPSSFGFRQSSPPPPP